MSRSNGLMPRREFRTGGCPGIRKGRSPEPFGLNLRGGIVLAYRGKVGENLEILTAGRQVQP